MKKLCFECQALQARSEYPEHTYFSRMQLLGEEQPDEFVDFIYYVCVECRHFWQESYSTYHNDTGWHWKIIPVEEMDTEFLTFPPIIAKKKIL